MTPVPDAKAELIEVVRDGFASLSASLQALVAAQPGTPLDLTGIQEGLLKIAEKLDEANIQASTVIGDYSDGARVKVFSETPA